jgi:hypothetical protein
VTDGADGGVGDGPADAPTNDGHRFDRLPETADDRVVAGRSTRRAVIDWASA